MAIDMDSMIQAASEHLIDVAPQSCSSGPRQRRSKNQQDNDELVTTQHGTKATLADYVNSFPLVPLPIVPQLDIADLEKLEHGLSELLGSLRPHDNDRQLSEYAARQMALVQRHLMQQRAQERVLRMLRGDLLVDLVPIGENTLRTSSSAPAAMQIGVLPESTSKVTASTESSSEVLSRVVKSQPNSHSKGDEAVNWHWTSKKAAIEMARAMVQANAVRKKTAIASTSFMVSSGGNASKKRRRPYAPTQRTREEEAQYQAQQLERERESRRRAAYQRLQARLELQAKKKKQKTLETTRQKRDEALKIERIKKEDDEKELNSNDSDSDSSDVSNCSESDEANEKAILELDVHVESSHTDENASPTSGQSQSDDEVDAHDDICITNVKDRSGDRNEHVEATSRRSSFLNPDGSTPRDIERGKNTVVLASDDIGADEHLVDDTTTECEALFDRQQHEPIVFDLQSFVALRSAAMLDQLQAPNEARHRVAINTSTSPALSSTSDDITLVNQEKDMTDFSLPRSDHVNCSDAATSYEKVSAIQRTELCGVDSSDLKGATSWIDEVRQSAVEVRGKSPERLDAAERALSLPRTPMAECKNYQLHFNNFHCILTSVFEQYRGSSSSSSSLYHRPVGASGEHTMRIQQKLYQSWQSIMKDYATVFGPKIVAPEGLIPVAAAKPWTPHYRINSTARKEVSEIVTQALHSLDTSWEEHPSGLGLKTTWNLLWTWSKPRVERQTLLVWQKVNHFQHAKALTRKDCLKKLIGKYLGAGERLRQAFDIIPPTFLLPKEYVSFVQAFHERSEQLRRSGYSQEKNIWIMKPVALSRGRGISLINDLSQVIYGEQVVIQEYIAAPRLLDGFKFDLRLYVLVTSFNPLEAFLYDEGFVRLCTRPYQDSDITNIFVHLTNTSIQKDHSEEMTRSGNPDANILKANMPPFFSHDSEAAQSDVGGTKTSLAFLWKRLAAEGVDVEQVKRNIEEVVIKALLCGEDEIPFQVNSFDLLGYDILLDTDLRPWLIEINSSPSMARDNDLDHQVKDAMMLDTLRIVDPLHFDRTRLMEIIARRQHDLDDERRRPHAHTRHPREAEELAARQLNEDLTAILRGKVPRAYGEIPENIGNYRRLCPHTTIYNQLVKLKRSCLKVGSSRRSRV